MYLRYIYKLHDLHLAAENYTEAGFTMKLYADQLSWETNLLPADHAHPQQPEWQRKELLYHQIIHYFDRGKCWEKGIPLCKELAVLYETRLYDYAKLGLILKTQAKFLDNILTQLRPEPEYFRVGFYGLSFPLFVRVIIPKHFIKSCATKLLRLRNYYDFTCYLIAVRGFFLLINSIEQTVHLSRIGIRESRSIYAKATNGISKRSDTHEERTT